MGCRLLRSRYRAGLYFSVSVPIVARVLAGDPRFNMDVTLRKGDFNPLYPEGLVDREVEVAHDEELFHYVLDEAPLFHMQCVDAIAKKLHHRFRD